MAKTSEPHQSMSVESSRALDSLTSDPRSVRTHSERNLSLISQSLQEVVAARSIVVDEAGVILAGNATVTAAQLAGIARVQVIDADGSELVTVRRSILSAEQKRRLVLLDNRTAELADWDSAILTSLAEDRDLSNLIVGGGSSSLGYRMAGFRELLAVEWDALAVDTLQLSLPDVPVWSGG